MRRLSLLFLLPVVTAIAQDQPRQLLQQSNARARALVMRAIAAHGGARAIDDMRTVWLDEAGRTWLRTQGPLPGRPLTARSVRSRVMIDVERDRGCYAPDAFTHSDTTRVEDMFYVYHPRTIVRDGRVTDLSMWMRRRSEPRSGGLQSLRPQQRLLPTTWLVDALAAGRTLRALGDETLAGAHTSLVAMTTSDGRSVTLRLAADGLLRSIETLGVDPAEGDFLSVVEFGEYQRTGGVQLPRRRIEWVDRDRVLDVRASRLSVNEGIDESCLIVPDDFVTSPPAPRPATEAVKLADRVYLLQALGGAYNALAILFDTFVMVVEAPENSPTSGLAAQAMSMVKAVAGERPIRYLAFTHFHTDHAGGVRDYIAAGATILTTPATRPWVEQAASARFAIVPDRLALAPRAVHIETIGDRHVIGKGAERVELHMVPWDHAREELVVYVPQAKLVFEGDLFASGEGQAPIAQRSAELLAETIRARGLDVERIVGVHGRVRPFSELERAIARRRDLLGLNAQARTTRGRRESADRRVAPD
jgi:glyoxylase-like metal-dependent hydrolase (beta-lactamase superfamily II)